MHGKILLTETWIALTNDPECLTLESVHMESIERFVVWRYSNTCASSSVNHVNDARYNLLFTGSHSLENIPSTQAAIFEHVKRSVLQGSFICKQVIVR